MTTNAVTAKSLVFDFGGVLFNWRPADLLRSLFPHHAPDADAAQVLVKTIFQGLTLDADWAAFDQGRIEPEPLAEQIAARTGMTVGEVAHLIGSIPDHLSPKPDTVELLGQLHDAGVPLYFLSNMPAPYARELEARHAFLGYFKTGVFSGDVGLSKPDPQIYALAAERTGRPASSLIFIDDLAENIDVAIASGWGGGVVFKNADQAARDLRALGIGVGLLDE
jgi:putative hydrolase of the HAD superfamily